MPKATILKESTLKTTSLSRPDTLPHQLLQPQADKFQFFVVATNGSTRSRYGSHKQIPTGSASSTWTNGGLSIHAFCCLTSPPFFSASKAALYAASRSIRIFSVRNADSITSMSSSTLDAGILPLRSPRRSTMQRLWHSLRCGLLSLLVGWGCLYQESYRFRSMRGKICRPRFAPLPRSLAMDRLIDR